MNADEQFKKAFYEQDYEKAYKYYIEYSKQPTRDIENFDEYLKISEDIYNNLDKYSTDELVKKAKSAAIMMQDFLVQSLCMITLIKSPKRAEIFYIWAKFALDCDYYWEAKEVIEQSYKLNKPDNPEKYLQLGAKILCEIYTNENLTKKSKNLYKKRILEYIKLAQKFAPDDVENYLLLTKYYALDFPNTDNKNIIKAWNKAIKLEPDNGWFYSSRAGIKHQDGDYKGAISDYKKAIKYGDTDYTTYHELAKNYYMIDQTQKALKLYQNAIITYQNNPDMQKEMYLGLATVNYRLWNFKKVEEIYTLLIEKYPDDLRFYALRAYARYDTKNYEGGIADADFVLSKNNPEYTTTYLSKAVCLEKLERYDEALECCDKAIEIYPDYFAPYLNKSLVLCSMGKCDEALVCIEKTIELDPEYSDGIAQRGYVKFYLKNYKEAFADLDKAIKIDKNNYHAHRLKAFFYFILGDMKKALKNINLALEINKNSPYQIQEYFLRHKIYKQLGKEKPAKADYDKTFELEPDFNIEDFEKTLHI
ncbi:MAG: tetratricopeptide repeat protein [Candidatus Gastranaerophilaceae bacterium]